ncbi:MAG TPA: hypothetical protein VHK24_12380, partial [Steroidobacter sp.]|nr:hypothetical protein [Steroidobacter sp.]
HSAERRQSSSFEETVRNQLERLLNSAQFDASTRSREFLRFVVDEALAGRSDRLNQAALAAAVFGRKGNFDPVLDPIVRVQAGRLRRSLERYYLLTGVSDSIRIELPKGGYAPVFVTAEPNDAAPDVAIRLVSLTRIVPDWPIVAIQPFDVSSSDGEETAERIADELTMELFRYGDVRVLRQREIDRLDLRQQASVRFELRGNLDRQADDAFIGTRLIDRTTGEQLWGDEYHASPRPRRSFRSVEDVARVIAARIGAEHGVIVRRLAAEHGERRTDATDAYSAILRCYRFFFSREPQELIPSVEALERLTTRDPAMSLAWTYLARLYLANHSFELSSVVTPIEKAIATAYEAVMLNPAAARARCVLAAALLVNGDLQAMQDVIEQALRLNPGSLAYREVIGWLTALGGNWDRGMALMRDAMARNPYCMPQVRHGLWAYYLRRGEYQHAYVAALEYRDSRFFWRELMTTSCLGHLGRSHEARASAAELLRLKPDFPSRGRTLISHYIKCEELREQIVEGLSKAGLTLK